ncbi:hypothetical protein [Maritalea porphyrae]|uniref:Uncharacterized protein n=1 Tax=Maritalea porphyrae TaxID=880732 RepID=A0ABQ5UPT0_9HYPH|nr:hypothetical protein [Maritalea porphyrae]GLQ17283.1 hypothetical protein GCM10007879_15320 [Maritalea porphyrae]
MNSFFKQNNMWLLAAALLSFATTALHVVGGTPEIMSPLNASNAPELSKGIAEVMWNQITLLLIVGGWVFWRAARTSKAPTELSLTIIALYSGITILFIASGINLFASVWVMPQWTLFLAMVLLAIVGLYRKGTAA